MQGMVLHHILTDFLERRPRLLLNLCLDACENVIPSDLLFPLDNQPVSDILAGIFGHFSARYSLSTWNLGRFLSST